MLRLRELATRIGATSCAPRPPRCSTTPSGARAPAWRRCPTARVEAADVLEARDGDLELRLRATVAGDELTLDFTGSAGQDRGNLNCPLAVTRSACLFAVRVLTDPDIPPSAGAHRPVNVVTEPGTLLDARAAGRGRRAATSRPARAWPTSCCARSGTRSARAR